MKWYTFSQNNSGGYFVDDDNVCEIVSIQARNAESAVRFARHIMDNSDSCPCCGDRWSFYMDESDGYDVPTVYGRPLVGYRDFAFRRKVILHYASGDRQTIEFK
jgi:hypothetical protein